MKVNQQDPSYQIKLIKQRQRNHVMSAIVSGVPRRALPSATMAIEEVVTEAHLQMVAWPLGMPRSLEYLVELTMQWTSTWSIEWWR